MIINKLHYKVYGKLIDRDIDWSPGITIILGDNEAGKSTIFNSLATLIYGFKPSSRDRHPYVNWMRNEINFSSEITESGELFTVERSLKSMPRLNISRVSNNTAQLYRNETLPFVSHVSEALFKAVFHLTADDLNQFERVSFESIQEKLIFNYGTDYLNKASDVILQLEQDINALWRKDKRGNPKINLLQSDINQLKFQKHEAEKSYGAVRTHILRIEAIDATLERSLSDKKSLGLSIRKMRINLPIKELIERIDTLNGSIFKFEAFKVLDVKLIDKIEHNHVLMIEGESNAEKRRQERDKLKEDLFIYSEHDKKILNFKLEIEYLKNTLSDLMRFEHEEHTKLDELMKLQEKIGGQFKILFDSQINDDIKKQLKKLPVLDLMTLLQKYIDGLDKNVEIDKQALARRSRMQRGYLILGISGIVASVLGFVYEPLRVVSFAGIGIFGFSIAHIKWQGPIGLSELVDLSDIKQKIEEASLSIQLPEYVYRDNSLRFFGKLEQLILLLHEEDALHDKWTSLIEHQKTIEVTLSNVMQSKGFDTSRGVLLSLQYVLAQIDRLREIDANEVKKQMTIDRLEVSIESERMACETCEALYNTLRKQVEDFGDGDFDFGLRMVAQNTELTRKIKVYTDELSLIHYDKDTVLNASSEKLLEMEVQIAEIDALEKQLIAEKFRLSSEIDRYNETVNLEAINSQILVAEAQLDEWIEHRNKWMILLEIIKFSDDRYRVENQPNIITRVSHFMNQMTSGKYQEVLVSEEDGHFELQFVIDGEIVPVAKAFSKGTLQQLFFAYRLAVIEALDPQNQLPFVLDEAFVNWDSKRFLETLKLLEKISANRQIMIFTCHRNLAIQIAECTTSKLIEVAE